MGLELGSDHRLEMTVARAETSEQVENLAQLEDGVADVAKLIGEAFELGAVVVDGYVTLMKAAQLVLEVDGALEFIAEEELFNDGPQGVGGEMGLVDDVEDGLEMVLRIQLTMQGSMSCHSPVRSAVGVGDRTCVVSPNLARTELKKQHHWE